MNKFLPVVMILIFTLIFVSGCMESTAQSEQPEPVEEYLTDELPAEVQNWIEESRKDFASQTLTHENILYLLITYGEKPTGGYDVEIIDINEEGGRLVVNVLFTEPAEDEMVTQVLTYPYDLAMLEDPGLPVEFQASGAETVIPVK